MGLEQLLEIFTQPYVSVTVQAYQFNSKNSQAIQINYPKIWSTTMPHHIYAAQVNILLHMLVHLFHLLSVLLLLTLADLAVLSARPDDAWTLYHCADFNM